MPTTITPTNAAKNASLDALVDLLDVGSADATADLVLKTAGGVTIATLTFSNPAFAAAASGSVTASAIAGVAAEASGTVTNFEARNRDNSVVFTGSVGTSGEALNLEAVAINSGDSVSVTSFTIA
jgi:hypothetical protein